MAAHLEERQEGDHADTAGTLPATSHFSGIDTCYQYNGSSKMNSDELCINCGCEIFHGMWKSNGRNISSLVKDINLQIKKFREQETVYTKANLDQVPKN